MWGGSVRAQRPEEVEDRPAAPATGGEEGPVTAQGARGLLLGSDVLGAEAMSAQHWEAT